MTIWAILVQLLIGVATVGTAYRVGRRNIDEASRGTQQREDAARREEWWRRFSWALAAIASDNDRESQLGYVVLSVLVESPLAGPDERAIARRASDAALAPLDPGPQSGDTGGGAQ